MRRLAVIFCCLALSASGDVEIGHSLADDYELIYVAPFGYALNWITGAAEEVAAWWEDAVAYWPIDADEDPWQDAIGTNDLARGAAGANPTWVAATNGISGHGSFDGVDYAESYNGDEINFGTNDFTVSCVFKCPSTWAGNRPMMSKQSNAGTQIGWTLYGDNTVHGNTKPWWYIDKGASTVNVLGLTDKLSDDVWHVITLVRDGATGYMYKDGVDITLSSGDTSGNLDNEIGFKLARDRATVTSELYAGHPALWGEALSPATIQSNYYDIMYGGGTNGFGMPQYIYDDPDNIARDGLRLALTWREDQDIVQDWSGNGNHGDRSASGTTHQGTYINIAAAGSVAVTSVDTTNSVVFWADTGGGWACYAKVGATEYVDGIVQAFTEGDFYAWSGTDLTIGTGNDYDFGNFYVFTNSLTQAQVQTISSQDREY